MFETRHLTRRFGELVAVDDVSLEVPDGATVGFIGGNGAGKTTTMRMIMGLLGPDAGEVLWDGAPITAAERRRIGYMPEERGLYPKQRVLDQLVYLARLHGAGAAAARAEAVALLEAFGLGERTDEKLEKLSLGNQQRVQVTAAVMTEPAALILDEPFSGLDPEAVDSLAEVLRSPSSSDCATGSSSSPTGGSWRPVPARSWRPAASPATAWSWTSTRAGCATCPASPSSTWPAPPHC